MQGCCLALCGCAILFMSIEFVCVVLEVCFWVSLFVVS